MSEKEGDAPLPLVSPLRQQYIRLLRKCTPKARKWLRLTYQMAGQTDAARERLGYSKRSVWVWLRLPQIQQILALQAQMAEEDNDLTPARIQREYGRLGFSSLKDFYREDGSLKKPTEWTEDQAAAVQEYGFNRYGPYVKLHAKPLDAIAKIRRLMVERHELTGKDGAPLPAARTYIVTKEEAEQLDRELDEEV